MQILSIEDEPADTELVERVIKVAEHKGIFVSDLQAAKEILQKIVPDLILVDVILNHSRVGEEFVRELRAQGYMQPIIALTALALPSDIQQCYAAGFTEVLTKPYAPTDLARILTKYQI